MIESLRSATRAIHKELESLMMSSRIMDGTLTQTELNQLLITNYIFFKEISKVKHPELTYFIPNRVDTLKKDLIANNVKVPTAFEEINIDLNIESNLVGVAYVTLGSTLGGSMISKQLARNENLKEASYNFYSESNSHIKLWKEFLSFLENKKDLDENLVCQSAIESFKYFKKNI